MTGATVDELRERLEDITAQRREHERQRREHEQHITRLAAEEADARARLDVYAADEMALRPIGVAPIRARRTRSASIPLGRVRDAVVTLGRFSVSELAAELECKPAQARRALERPEIAAIVEPIAGRERYGCTIPAPDSEPEPEPVVIDEPRKPGEEVVVLRLQTGRAAIKGKLGEDVSVAYTTQSPREIAS